MFRVQSLQRPEDKLPGIPEIIFWMFRKSSPGILEVDVISRVFRKLSPGYFGKCFPVCSGKCFPGMFRKSSPVCSVSLLLFATKSMGDRELCTSWPLSVCYGVFLCHEVQDR